MLVNTRKVRIEWGQCDPFGIVFYPRYFEIFDACISALFERALGMTKFQFIAKYDALGYAMVESRGRFLKPTRFGDDVTIDSTVTKFGRSSFDVSHRLFKDGELCVEGFETRVWVGRDPADPKRIKAKPIPAEIIERLSRTG
jgi:4-hydroxybenzoyl-CoA thioesterase